LLVPDVPTVQSPAPAAAGQATATSAPSSSATNDLVAILERRHRAAGATTV
jgi:hypothetical protein